MSIDRKNLVAVAKEMNKVMGLDDPEIDVTVVDAKLEKQIKTAAELIAPTDKFSKETTAILKEMGLLPSKSKKDDEDEEEEDEKPSKKSKKTDKDEDEENSDEDEDEEDSDEDEDEEEDSDEDEDEEDEEPKKKGKKVKKEVEEEEEEEDDEEKEEEEEEGNIVQKINKTAKLAGLKEIVKEDDQFKKLRKSLDDYTGIQGPRELKAAMYKILGVDPPKPAPRPTGSGKKRGKGGLDLAKELLAKDASEKEIIKAFIAMYKERGQDDEDFIKGRAKIYIKLAGGKVKKDAPVKEEKKSKKSKSEDDEDDDDE